jgi:hypothetical protein
MSLAENNYTLPAGETMDTETMDTETMDTLSQAEGLWVSSSPYIPYIVCGKDGEISTNRLEDQEVAVLSLHLLQICIVYINTLMIQEVLSSVSWSGRLTEEYMRGLTPLLYGYVNPYGRFELDMSKCLLLGDATHTM